MSYGLPMEDRDAPSNADIAQILDEVAELLEAQGANPFRVRAWRMGAGAVRAHPEPVTRILARGGEAALDALPHIGPGLARSIAEAARRGRLAMLDRLRGEVAPEDLFATLPGVGPVFAHRIHEALGVETLEELEIAAHDGRLAQVPGIGERRAEAIRELLGHRLATRRRSPPGGRPRPDVATLLDVDRLYRTQADKGELPRIAPRRFNPDRESWLPILHTEAHGWDFTALYSNTARAHELGKTGDWVVIYYARNGGEGQCTVVTETQGRHAGERVVRGREPA